MTLEFREKTHVQSKATPPPLLNIIQNKTARENTKREDKCLVGS